MPSSLPYRTFAIALASLLALGCPADGSDPPADTDAATSGVDDDDDTASTSGDPEPTTTPASESSSPTTTDAESSDGSSEGPEPETTGEPEGPQPTPGCGTTDLLDTLNGTIDVGGVARTYVLVQPDDYDPDTLYPIIFGFHGAYDTGAGAQLGYRLEQWWEGEAIVVYPDALAPNGFTFWDYASGSEDFEFVLALYEAIGTAMCFDQGQAFTFGYSAGGYMANSLGCFRGDLFRGVGAISGGVPSGDCTGPQAVFAAHGETDTTVPISSGIAARDRWLAENECSDTTTPTGMEGCVAYEGCRDGYPLVWCTHPGAHMFLGWTAEAAVAMFRDLPF